MQKKKIVIVGGGAAGFFAAANLPADHRYEVILLEATQELMKKILISGGGRCNVTHACFDPKNLITYYPRGHRQLLGPFFTFNPTHTLDWFKQKKITIVKEEDNRMFPSTNTSETIANSLFDAAIENKVHILKGEKVHEITVLPHHRYLIYSTHQKFEADFLIIATGSNFPFQKILKTLEIDIVEPVASLFTFNVPDKKLTALMGVSFPMVSLKIKNTKLTSEGPMLITHWGLSGPAILKLSAWGAREFQQLQYQFALVVNFANKPFDEVLQELNQFKQLHPKKSIHTTPLFNIPKRYWSYLLESCSIAENTQWANIPKASSTAICKHIVENEFVIKGKSTYKDEFVTAGGVALDEINFKSFQHKRYPNMYFIGEVLDIDGVTGGFNFQNCWTGAYIAAKDILANL